MRQGPDRWALIRKEGSFGGWGGNTHPPTHIHTHATHMHRAHPVNILISGEAVPGEGEHV